MPLIYGGGASSGQITLYGAQAQAAWAMISGQEFKIPQGQAAGNGDYGGIDYSMIDYNNYAPAVTEVGTKVSGTRTAKKTTSNGSSPLSFWSDFFGSVGTLGSAVENLAGNIRIGKNFAVYGIKKIDYRSLIMGTLKFRNSTFSLVKSAKVLGESTFVIGVAIDLIGVYNYNKYGADDKEHFTVHPGKFGLNTGVGIWALAVGGIGGAVGGALYFGIDVFYPGGWPAASARSAQLEENERRFTGHSFFSNSALKQ